MERREFLKSGAVAALGGLAARSWAADLPTKGDLAGDVAILREALKLHPGLYRYNTPTEFEAKLQRFGRDFTAAADRAARYLALARLTAEIRCGHSYANFFNQKDAVAAELFDRKTRLPLHFIWLGEQMVVLRDPSGTLPRGTRIERLNGADPARLRKALQPLIRTDGHNEAKRISLLEVRGDEKIETFDVFQGLIAPPPGGVHRLSVVEPGGKRRQVELPAIGLAERRAAMVVRDTNGDQPFWDWAVRPDGIAVLTMPSWSTYNSKWDWESWLNQRLDSLGGASGLLVDLRDNEGGRDCGDLILGRLVDQPWVPPAMEQRLRFQRTPAALDPYLDTWDKSFRTMGVGAKPLPDGFYLRPSGEDALSVPAAGKRLGVPLAVLISPVNSSATYQFANNVRTLNGGKLYGRTTGGNLRGINGGAYFFVRLPASGLEFDLPLVGYYPTTPQPDAGVVPDVAITPTVRDIAEGRDPTLERAAADLARG